MPRSPASDAVTTPRRPRRTAKPSKPRTDPNGDGERLLASELCRQLGISEPTMSEYRKAGAPFGADNRTTKAEFRRWELATVRAQAAARATPTSEDEARARKLAAEAEMAELKLARERGQVVTVTDAAAAYEARLVPVRAALMAVPGRWAPEVVGLGSTRDAMQVMSRLVREVLGALGDTA